MIWQVLYNGLITGALYGLVALGYSLTYGVSRLINFAHGDVMMVSAYVSLWLMTSMGWPTGLAVLGAMGVGGILGLLVEALAVRPSMRSGDPLAPVIATIGASIVMQASIGLAFGTGSRVVPAGSLTDSLGLGPVETTRAQLLTIVTAGVLVGALLWFLRAHRLGRALRAVADDVRLAENVGINPRMAARLTFAVSGVLAGFAGLALATDASLRPTMGYAIGFRGFTAAIIGGIGNPLGALAGAVAMGMVSSLAGTYMSSEWVPAYVFGCLVLTLLFRPQGLFPARAV